MGSFARKLAAFFTTGSTEIDEGFAHSAEQICGFETRHGVTLPEEYREYMLTHRTGFMRFGYYGVDVLENWCQPEDEAEMPADFLKTAFPHSKVWNDKTLFQDTKGFNSEYFSVRFATGSMRIVNLGCESYALLVVSGPERGNVWVDRRVDSGGIYPVAFDGRERVGFREFVEKWKDGHGCVKI